MEYKQGIEVKDCPFCGNSWGPPQIDKADGGRMVMTCMNPRCGASTGWCDSEEDAIKLWNTRNEWQPIETAPTDGSEFLTRNNNQGGVMQLVSWNRLHNFWQSKGESIYMQATHWLRIPAFTQQQDGDVVGVFSAMGIGADPVPPNAGIHRAAEGRPVE